MRRLWKFLKDDTGRNGAWFTRENENLSSSADVLQKTSNLAISCCCFADDGKEMNKSEKRHVRGEQRYFFCQRNMQICDVLVAVALVVAY